MTLYFNPTTKRWMIRCACGFTSIDNCTLEAAGRNADLHMAEVYPIGSERQPCAIGDAT